MKIHVIGESCTDIYVYGRCPRLSPEAPVPVFVEEGRFSNGGMALNVAANLQALGANCVIHTHPETILKVRYVEESRNHALLRVDDDPSVKAYDMGNGFGDGDAVVLVDYNKGFLPRVVIERITGGCAGRLPVFLDTKKPLDGWCRHATWIKINEQEARASQAFLERAEWLQKRVIVTMGKHGCRYGKDHYPVEPVEVMDAAGCGDTFLAGFVVGWLKHQNVKAACEFANQCARSVVGKRGTAIVVPPIYGNTTG